MLLIVLPSSGQFHPLEAQIIAPGRDIKLQTFKTRNQLGAVQEWLARLKGGRDGARQGALHHPISALALGRGRSPCSGLRGLGKSKVKPAQYQVLAAQKNTTKFGFLAGSPREHASFLLPAHFPTVSHQALQQLRCRAETLNMSVRLG